MEDPLLLPISTTNTTTSTNTTTTKDIIVIRITVLLAVAFVSLYAFQEAAKGFEITVVNSSATDDSVAARRFDVFFVSNGRAARMLYHASKSVEQALYPDTTFPRKPIRRVTLQMTRDNHTSSKVSVPTGTDGGNYVIFISPSQLMSTEKYKAVTLLTDQLRNAMARVWLYDAGGAAPRNVVESMVRYLAGNKRGGMYLNGTDIDEEEEEDETTCMSARFLEHCEERSPGFVARLNRAMRDLWDNGTVDDVLGESVRHVCAAYKASRSNKI